MALKLGPFRSVPLKAMSIGQILIAESYCWVDGKLESECQMARATPPRMTDVEPLMADLLPGSQTQR